MDNCFLLVITLVIAVFTREFASRKKHGAASKIFARGKPLLQVFIAAVWNSMTEFQTACLMHTFEAHKKKVEGSIFFKPGGVVNRLGIIITKSKQKRKLV